MSKLGCLLLVWAICEGVVTSDEDNGFVQSLDFAPLFDSGVTSLASNPLAAAVLNVDKNQYPQLFDTVVSSSIDSLQTRASPVESVFSAESFGFNPIASQSFLPPGRSAKLVDPQRPQQNHQQAIPIGQQLGPLRYDIRTVHDANYKVYKPEDEDQEEILSALKKNPSVSAYFKPADTTVEVAHPLKYRREELSENSDVEPIYKPNTYITGHPRIRRYTSGRKANLKKNSEDEEDDPYNYKVEYLHKPKAFDSDVYSSAYKAAKDPNKEYEYPYGGYDSGYDHKEYERIKALSEKQAAEIKQNKDNCKDVTKDGMTCTTCKDPKTGGNFESCSYVAEPKNNKYAYSKERKFDSNDEPDEVEAPSQSEPVKKSEKYQEASDSSEHRYAKLTAPEPHKGHDSGEKYNSYYSHSSQPKKSEALRAADDKQNSAEEGDSTTKGYDYKKALPGFYTDNEQKKDVEHVLAEFQKKDRSTCKKVQKNGMTCFQCLDSNGLKNEECMFVSESAPKRSHLAYQELKEFTSKPATLDNKNNEGAESITITTSAPPAQKSAAYVVDNSAYGKKLKRKKAPQAIAVSANSPVSVVQPAPSAAAPRKTRSAKSPEQNAKIIDETNIAPPEEFAGAESKGAFWAETMPRYSPTLGVTLPEFMLSRSEHEVSFDETVAGA